MISPSLTRELAEPCGRSKPHRPVRPLGNRGHRIGGETVARRVVREMAVLQFAHTTAERSSPNRPIDAFINGIDAVLHQTVRLCVCLGCKRIAGVLQMSEPTPLSSHPDIILVGAGDGINDIVSDLIRRYSPTFSSLQPSQTALNRRDPSATIGINVWRPRALRFRIGKRVSNKGAVS